MSEDMVMRSVYLRPTEDALLRQLAFDLKVSKSDLIRSAISLKLRDWLASDEDELILKDVEFGRKADMAAITGAAAAPPAAAPLAVEVRPSGTMAKFRQLLGAGTR